MSRELKVSAQPTSTGRGDLPPQVVNLAWREREIAELIYRIGPMTARDIEKLLRGSLTNGAIRSMLVRLCRKGILNRHRVTELESIHASCIPYVYSPAITPQAIRIYALRRVAREYFQGSIGEVAKVVSFIMEKDGSGRHTTSVGSPH
jgi:predicted transcriptional regulator